MLPEPGSGEDPDHPRRAAAGGGPGEQPTRPETPDGEALDRALRFIEYRPRSRGETRDRLRRWGYPPASCQAVVEYLERCGLLDDREFGRVFLGEMLRKNFGYYRIRSELLKKRLERRTVDEILEDYPSGDEMDRALAAAHPMARRIQRRADSNAVDRITASLMRRGYPRSVARRAASIACDVDTENWRE